MIRITRNNCCCFTGHRPEKMKKSESEVKCLLEKEIRHAIDDGFTVFISGMARGTDIWAAEIVLSLRESGIPLKLICASPYPDFEAKWSNNWQKRYKNIMQKADFKEYISPKYNRSCFQKRNEWMVNHSSRVIAVYNGKPSGTRNTIAYADTVNIHCIIIDV